MGIAEGALNNCLRAVTPESGRVPTQWVGLDQGVSYQHLIKWEVTSISHKRLSPTGQIFVFNPFHHFSLVRFHGDRLGNLMQPVICPSPIFPSEAMSPLKVPRLLQKPSEGTCSGRALQVSGTPPFPALRPERCCVHAGAAGGQQGPLSRAK